MPDWIKRALDDNRKIYTELEKDRALNYLSSLRAKGKDEESKELYARLFPYPKRHQDTELNKSYRELIAVLEKGGVGSGRKTGKTSSDSATLSNLSLIHI